MTFDRTTAARLGITPSRTSTTSSTTSSPRPSRRPSTSPSTSTTWSSRRSRSSPPGRHALDDTYIQTSSGIGAARPRSPRIGPRTGPLSVNHTGLYPSSTISFNLAPGFALGDATAQIHQLENELADPQERPRHLLRHRAAVPGVARLRAAPGRGGHLRRLRPARDPLRELPPPGHHPHHPPLGGARRGHHPHPVQLRPERHLAHRDHPPHRNREEERHHDDRLRSTGGARARPGERRGDLPGLRASLPSHPHDHRRRASSAPCPWPSEPGSAPSCAGRWGFTIIGGLIVSQVLTLYSTPVVYLMLDRLRARFVPRKSRTLRALAA